MKQKNIPWELIISKFKQEISEEDNAELMSWAADPECGALLEDLKVLWQKIQLKSSNYTPDKDYYWKELSRRMNKAEQEEKAVPVRKAVRFRSLYRYAMAACMVLAIGMSYYWGVAVKEKSHIEQVYTCMSGKSRISLPDGSNVWLHANTTLICSDDFGGRERLVKMSGEAYFEVVKDEKKKFVVQTEGMQVLVHGTKFNVGASAEDKESKVSLVEGSVSLKTSSEEVFLKPGDIAVYDKENNRLAVAAGDVEFDRLWMKDKLIISNESLGDVCRFLSRWYDVEIHLEDGLKSKYQYTFTLRDEPLEEILRLMSRINPIAYSFDEDNVLTISTGSIGK